jgi:hypothetical protein
LKSAHIISRSQDSVACRVTRLWAGWSGVHFARRAWDFSFLQNVQPFCVLIFMMSACTVALNWTETSFSYTVKVGFYIPWISMCIDSVHIFATPTKMSVRLFSRNIYIYIYIYMYVHSYVQVKHKNSCLHHIHYFQLDMRKEKLLFSYSFLSSCMLTINSDCASTVVTFPINAKAV